MKLFDFNGNKIDTWLSVYAVSRHYGGPEEGGWWYNWYDYTGVSRIVLSPNVELDEWPAKFQKIKLELLAQFEDEQPKHDIYSMANEGPQYEVMADAFPGASQSNERPHFE